MGTKIEWTDETINLVTGCSKVSEGCRNCYAERMDRRQMMVGRKDGFRPWTAQNAAYNVRLHPERLEQLLRWRKPRRVFVNSMSDLFHEQVPDEFIDRVFAVMALAKKHTFQVLTKREKRMQKYITGVVERTKGRYLTPALLEHAGALIDRLDGNVELAEVLFKGANTNAGKSIWPLPNVWLGVSAEDPSTLYERVVHLFQTPAAMRFVSLEPMLGPVNAVPYLGGRSYRCGCGYKETESEMLFLGGDVYRCADCDARMEIGPTLDWVIVGGESGPGARPMRPDWVRKVRDDCRRANVPFFFKQWGEWKPVQGSGANLDNPMYYFDETGQAYLRVGKKAAGALLDGQNWYQYPEGEHAIK